MRGLSGAAGTFVIGVAIVLTLVLGLAIVATLLVDVGPLSNMLRVIAFIALCVLVLLGQRWLTRATKEVVDWDGGPLPRALNSTHAALEQQKRDPSD